MLTVLESKALYDVSLACLALSFHYQAFVVSVLPVDEPIIDLPLEHTRSIGCLYTHTSFSKLNYCN